MKIKDNVNKAQLFRDLTEIGKKRFEFTCEPDEDLKVFLDGAEQLFKLLRLPVVVSSATYNASHLWKKATEFTYALEKNGYLACLEDLEKAGIIELKNIDKNH